MATKRSTYLEEITARKVTPQTQAIPGREAEMHQMESGGFAFKKGPFGQLRRWLIVGSDKNEFYASKQVLTRDNAKNVAVAFAADPIRTVDTIVEVSDRGLAPKNDAAIFALALCLEMASRLSIEHSGTGEGEIADEWVSYVQAAAPKVCRIGTHLFQFATFLAGLDILDNRRGRDAITAILNGWNVKGLQVNLIKYRQRDGWTLAQLLDVVHPKTDDPLRGAAYQWANWAEDRTRAIGRVDGYVEQPTGVLPDNTVIWMGPRNGERVLYNIRWQDDLPTIWAFEQLRTEQNKARVLNLITDHRLPWEALPDQWLKDKDVWATLLPHMNLGALIRQLGKLTGLGVIGQTGAEKLMVIKKLTNAEELRKARIHPLAVLVAQAVYRQGHGDKGRLTWKPVSQVTDALESAFYGSFDAWEPTEKSRGLFIDVSGSMGMQQYAVPIGGTTMVPRMIATVMAMCVARKEQDHVMYGFAGELRDLGIGATDSLETAMAKAQMNNFGSTDPMKAVEWAVKSRTKLDTFEFFTDEQAWSGKEHVTQAITRYRKLVGDPKVKMLCFAITSRPWTLADPKDIYQADFPGFGTDTPRLAELFIRGELDVEKD